MKTQELFDIFPEAKAAQEKKTPWSYEPETAEAGLTLFHEDDDEDGAWYTTTICQGFEYDPETDEFLVTEWRCWDGDWDIIDSYPLDQYEAEYQKLSDEHDRTYRRYLEWVAEHGEDPCSEFYIQKNPREQQTWELTFKRRDDKTILTNWKQFTGTPAEEHTTPPQEIADYLDFTMKTRTCSDGTVQQYPSTHYPWEFIIDCSKNPNNMRDEWTETRTVRDWTFQVKAELWVTTHNGSYTEQLKAAARKALEN